MKSNLGKLAMAYERREADDVGPRGTIKMLVDGSGQIKMTKVSLIGRSLWWKLMSRMERSFYQRCRSRYVGGDLLTLPCELTSRTLPLP